MCHRHCLQQPNLPHKASPEAGKCSLTLARGCPCSYGHFAVQASEDTGRQSRGAGVGLGQPVGWRAGQGGGRATSQGVPFLPGSRPRSKPGYPTTQGAWRSNVQISPMHCRGRALARARKAVGSEEGMGKEKKKSLSATAEMATPQVKITGVF